MSESIGFIDLAQSCFQSKRKQHRNGSKSSKLVCLRGGAIGMDSSGNTGGAIFRKIPHECRNGVRRNCHHLI